MKDISGKKYGKLTVSQIVGKNKEGRKKWLCMCDCGGSGVYYKNNLDSGARRHCGCEANTKPGLTHGMRNHALYSIWKSMISRCDNEKNAEYKNYGGRGIKVCERWRSIENFIQDMHPKPEGGSIDRIDVDGNYEPSNVKWSSQKEQRWNQRVPCKIFPNGMTSEELAKAQGLKTSTIRMRIHRGWSDKEIINGNRVSRD